MAASGLVAVCQPRTGVEIWVMVLAAAWMAPSTSAVAVTVTTPAGGMTTSGNVHRVVPSLTIPLLIAVPTTPLMCSSA